MSTAEPGLEVSRAKLARAWALSYAVSCVVGFAYAGRHYLVMKLDGFPYSVVDTLQLGLVEWLCWGTFAPLVWLWVERANLSLTEPRRTVLRVLGAAAGFAAAHDLLHMGIDEIWCAVRGETMDLADHLYKVVIYGWWTELTVALGLIAAFSAALDHRRAHDRALRALQLEAALADARLEALRLQLDPHFLFNTLNGVSALVHKDPDRAERMLARLGDLLRVTLDGHEDQLVPLDRELEVLELYLDIEQARYGDRLQLAVSVGGDAGRVLVPSLFLQPLVENALRHGIARRPGGGRVAIAAHRHGDALEVTVRDDGPGLSGRVDEGVGLSTVRQRLAFLFGDAHQLVLADDPGGGALVRVRLPVREAA